MTAAPPRVVAQLLPALESGGVERSTLEIAQALTRAGHRAIVICAGGRLVPVLRDIGAEHVELEIGRKSPLSLRHVPTLRRLFVRERVDIVHARSRLPAWLGWWALRGLPEGARPHFVTTVHGLNSPSRYSAVMTRGERVICVSHTVQRYVLQHYPQVAQARLRVIPRGIDPASFPRHHGPGRQARARLAQAQPALAGAGPLLLLPGRGTRRKGHADALGVLAGLRATGLDARLWMPGAREAGREDYVAWLEGEATARGCADALAITPATSDIAQAYVAADLVLQVSRKPEAFGRTVGEALAVGRPVLGWDHGGVGELLAELQPRGAVPPFDTVALLRTAQDLIARPPEPPEQVPYTLAAMQDATLALYGELWAAPGTGVTASPASMA